MTVTKALRPGDIYPGACQEIQALTAANGGTEINTTAQFFVLPDACAEVELIGRNFTTAVAIRYALSPWLVVLKTTDLLAAIANVTDYSKAAANATTADVIASSLDTLANNNAFYIGSHVPFAGVRCISSAANANAATLAVTYWDGTAWTNITPTDGTVSAGKTFAQTGNVTWSVPSGWTSAKLPAIVQGAHHQLPFAEDSLYWTRWAVSAALDSSTTLASMIAINRSTAYAELLVAFNKTLGVYKGFGGVTAVQAIVDAGTANLILNAASRPTSKGLNL